MIDPLDVFPVRPHRAWPVQLVLLVWRWAVEIGLAVVVVVLVVKVDQHTGHGWRFSLLVVLGFLAWLAAVLLVWERSRPVVSGLFWCLVTRHRLRTWFVEARVYNRTGKLPWILFIRPTAVGERVWVWLVPGLSVENFTKATENLTAAAWARTVRVERSRKVGALVRVDVVRRDPLLASTVASVLIPSGRVRDEGGQEPTVTGRLEVPSEPVTLAGPNGPGSPVWGTGPVKKAHATRSSSTSSSSSSSSSGSGRAALSSQDGDVIPTTAPIITRGGEDVSDYV